MPDIPTIKSCIAQHSTEYSAIVNGNSIRPIKIKESSANNCNHDVKHIPSHPLEVKLKRGNIRYDCDLITELFLGIDICSTREEIKCDKYNMKKIALKEYVCHIAH